MSTTDAIRTRIAAQVLTVGGGLRESGEVYEFIRGSAHSPLHLEYAVASVSTETMSDRGRPPSVLARESMRVVLVYQLASKDRVLALTTLHQVEAAIRSALLAGVWSVDFTLPRWESTVRDAGLDGWIFSESAFSVHHALTV